MNNLNPDSPSRYDRLTMSLHWLTALLVIGCRGVVYTESNLLAEHFP